MKLVSKVLGSTILTGAVLFTGMQAGQANAEEEHYSQVTKDNAIEILKTVNKGVQQDYTEPQHQDNVYKVTGLNSGHTAQHYYIHQDGIVEASENGAGTGIHVIGQYKLTPKFSTVNSKTVEDFTKYYIQNPGIYAGGKEGDHYSVSRVYSGRAAAHYKVYKDGTITAAENGVGYPPFTKVGKFPLKNKQ